jgi:hypothetical protein
VLLLALGACGDEGEEATGSTAAGSVEPSSTEAPSTEAPSTEPDTVPRGGTTDEAATTDGEGSAPAGRHDHPTGADEVVLEYEVGGGFTTPEYAFREPPRLLVSGDGRAFSVGPVAAVYPGPLLPNVQVRPISEDGIQQLLDAADPVGMLDEVEYEGPTTIADAPTTTLTITADGQTWVHSAYALGFTDDPASEGEESSPERQRLADFVAQLTDLTSLVEPAELGPDEAFVPDDYLVMATTVDDVDARAVEGIEPRVVDWPAGAATALADVGACAVVPAEESVSALFADADELTFFADGGTVYQVTPTPLLPGTGCPR